jgi:ABC-2 type transport system permease protein
MNHVVREPVTRALVYAGSARMRANLVALGTITRREVRRMLRIWTQTLVPPAISMTLYFVIFGKVIGSRVGLIHDFTYMQYIVPGLVMMSIINNSYGNITSSFFGSKFGRYVEELLASPMPSWVLLTGYVSGAVLRGVLVGIIVLGIALFFTSLHLAHPLVAVTTVLLGSAIFSLAGFINATFAKRFDDIQMVPTFVLTPLSYLGGVFYSISMLGSPWRELSKVNPILYMVNAFRYGILGVSDVPVWVAYVVMLAFVVVLGGFALWLLQKGVGLRS